MEAKSVVWFSPNDEYAFFDWLERIECVTAVYGEHTSIFVDVDANALTQMEFRELIAIFRRYQIDLSQLRSLDTPAAREWLKNVTADWKRQVFRD